MEQYGTYQHLIGANSHLIGDNSEMSPEPDNQLTIEGTALLAWLTRAALQNEERAG